MHVFVNNKEITTSALLLTDLLSELEIPAHGIAVAISGRIVPAAQWASTELTEGLQIVVVKAVCGG